MFGDIVFWFAVVFVATMLAAPMSENLMRWKHTGFSTPTSVHVCAVLLFIGFALPAFPVALVAAPSVYILYGSFGNHLAREMRRCEQQAGRGTEEKEAKIILSRELRPYKGLPRKELVAMLWKNVEKEVTAQNGVRHQLKIEVLSAIYRWEGGNVDHFSNLAKSVETGGDIKVLGMLVPVQQRIWRRDRGICLSFQMDRKGEIFADTTEVADAVSA